MRATPDMTRAITQAVRHLETNGAKYMERGRAIHGGSRLTAWKTVLEDCCNLRELQFHFDLFCSELKCATFVLHTTSSLTDMADQGLIYGVLPLLPIE